ncbi:uncharacterized protein LOC131612607 [Vicia villosa]|uniref:uncharacterized protein LOC131612607 n=1 Tax=Vicia villosa TaxID=3911 RepID=UPI00273CDAE2|nr:uncharacterized protein LOC131612607 [Vicia villosa]
MSGCPVLEKLTIDECIGCDHLVISSPSLKVLALEMCETMSICLKKANNLIDFTLEGYQGRCFIKSLPKIKRFSVERCIKYPYADIPTTLLASSFSSLEYLKLDHFNLNDIEDILYFVNVLKSAPRLIELVIKQSYNVDTTQVLDLSKELESHSCCLKLKTVKVYTRACSQHSMSLIKSILANSPLLKILTVCRYDKLDARMLLKISQDLLMMKRASPGAQVNFIHSTYGHY